MNGFGLTEHEQELLRAVFRRYPEVEEAKVFGSRAKGCAKPSSDIDLALCGRQLDDALVARIAHELDELPLPYMFDVLAYASIASIPLKEHIDRVGQTFYKRL